MVIRCLLKKVTWAVGSSLLCSQYTSGWSRPWPPQKKILDTPMEAVFKRTTPSRKLAKNVGYNYHKNDNYDWIFCVLTYSNAFRQIKAFIIW